MLCLLLPAPAALQPSVAGKPCAAKQWQPQSSSTPSWTPPQILLLSDTDRLHTLTDSLMTLVTSAQAITFASSPRAMLCISQRLGLAATYQIVNTCMRRKCHNSKHRGLSRGGGMCSMGMVSWPAVRAGRALCYHVHAAKPGPPKSCMHKAMLCAMREVCEQQAVSAKEPSAARCTCQMSAAEFVGGCHSLKLMKDER